VSDAVYLSNYLVNTKIYGVVVPPGTDPEFWATYEISGDEGTLFMAAVMGPDGLPGKDAFALKLQTTPLESSDQLPNTLTDSEADIGKYWIIDDVNELGEVIGSSMYVWYGTSWRRLMLGSPGPPGPVPVITPTVTVVDAQTHNSEITQTGSAKFPHWHLDLAVPPGPRGPAPTLDTCPDVDLQTVAPNPGDVLGYTGRRTSDNKPIWVPVSISQLIPSPYSMPESAFKSYNGVASQAPVGSYQLPPQPFAWTPIVWGHLLINGFELSVTPFTIGCEVRLGNQATGPIIGRGFGKSGQDVLIMPHYSSVANPTVALSPYNNNAVVPANHTDPTQGTIYVNLANDGEKGKILIADYKFSPDNAQIFIMVCPVAGNDPLMDSSGIIGG